MNNHNFKLGDNLHKLQKQFQQCRFSAPTSRKLHAINHKKVSNINSFDFDISQASHRDARGTSAASFPGIRPPRHQGTVKAQSLGQILLYRTLSF
jgi:hypothetical protein